MAWVLPIVTLAVAWRAPHHEFSGGNCDKLDFDRFEGRLHLRCGPRIFSFPIDLFSQGKGIGIVRREFQDVGELSPALFQSRPFMESRACFLRTEISAAFRSASTAADI